MSTSYQKLSLTTAQAEIFSNDPALALSRQATKAQRELALKLRSEPITDPFGKDRTKNTAAPQTQADSNKHRCANAKEINDKETAAPPKLRRLNILT
jgi:hypothetical protein